MHTDHHPQSHNAGAEKTDTVLVNTDGAQTQDQFHAYVKKTEWHAINATLCNSPQTPPHGLTIDCVQAGPLM